MDHIKTPKIDNVQLLSKQSARQSVTGCLYLTATHTIFMDSEGKKETWILHHHVYTLEKLQLTTKGSPLKILCKTFQLVTFVIPKDRDCQDVYDTIQHFSRPESLEDVYAFSYSPQSLLLSQSSGWNLFDAAVEFARMGVPNENWKASSANKDYKICDTYPTWLYVPDTVSSPIVAGSAKFRSRGRLPALSYYHAASQAAICRCSQPLAGVGRRSEEDEAMLQSILRANPNRPYMYVVDTRPRINAMANKARGKGYESEDFYSGIIFQFLGIQNIHVMRDSLNRLVEVCNTPSISSQAFLSGLEGSNHLKHIKTIIDTSFFIAKAIYEEKTSVVVHCSDGWDRTAQTCSLACILLDPYYRTMTGFMVLIEKEWLGFGHKFAHRCGQIVHDPHEISPVFTQFLDCVWQLSQQFPTSFEFNERFLLHIHDHVFSCQFGTFLGNCMQEREKLKLSEKTYSLWGFLDRQREECRCPFYDVEDITSTRLLRPSTAAQDYLFWKSMYNRYDQDVHSRESVPQQLSHLQDATTLLDHQAHFLRQRIAALRHHLGLAPATPSPTTEPVAAEPAELIDERPSSAADADALVAELTKVIDRGVDDLESLRVSVVADETDEEESKDERHDLVSASTAPSLPSKEELLAPLPAMSVKWKGPREATQCSCASLLEALGYRYHCWHCGEVFCCRCVDRQVMLPFQTIGQTARVCRQCFKSLR